MDISTRWPASMRSGIDSKTTDVNVRLLPSDLRVTLWKSIPSAIPIIRPRRSKGKARTAQRRVSICIAINIASDPIVAKSAAADTLSRSWETSVIANPAAIGTRRNTTPPIACVPGIRDKINPPTPNKIPVSPPTRTPLNESFQLCNLLLPCTRSIGEADYLLRPEFDFAILHFHHKSAAVRPSRCGRGCGIEWPRSGAWVGCRARLPGLRWCARLSGCGRGLGQTGPGAE